MVEWHHQLDGLEFEQALGVGDGQGNLSCCTPGGRKELGTTWRLNNNLSGDADIGNRLVDTVGDGESGTIERTAYKYIHYHM